LKTFWFLHFDFREFQSPFCILRVEDVLFSSNSKDFNSSSVSGAGLVENITSVGNSLPSRNIRMRRGWNSTFSWETWILRRYNIEDKLFERKVQNGRECG
jgi:hypothetical protein